MESRRAFLFFGEHLFPLADRGLSLKAQIQVFLHLLDAHAAFLQAYKILDPLQIPVVEDAAVILITLDIWDQPLVAIVF